ncbi:MAG TPA: DHHA1 domain-containing protein, partial [Erysipelothrix sp.]
QAGSYLDDRYFRFDFSHFEAVDKATLQAIEDEMNEMIVASIPVETHVTDMDTAMEMGALAFFEDKYGEKVRVVKMGDVSVELCGGTHVKNTAEIGMVKLLSEESVGSGVRRITGTSSLGVRAYYQKHEAEINHLRTELKIPVQKTLTQAVLEMKTQVETLETELAVLSDKMIALESRKYLDAVQENPEGLKTLWLELDSFDKKGFKALAESLGDAVDVLFAVNKLDDNAMLIAIASEKAIQKGYKAGDFIKAFAPLMDGRGGGRPNFAQGGGKDLSQIEAVKKAFTDKMF